MNLHATACTQRLGVLDQLVEPWFAELTRKQLRQTHVESVLSATMTTSHINGQSRPIKISHPKSCPSRDQKTEILTRATLLADNLVPCTYLGWQYRRKVFADISLIPITIESWGIHVPYA